MKIELPACQCWYSKQS